MLIADKNSKHISKLIEDIVLDHSKLNGISIQLYNKIINFSVVNNDYRVLDIIVNMHTGIYDFNEIKPDWLESDFYESVWVMKFGIYSKTINWDTIYLDDGKRLTDKKHQKLLNSFKYWITAVNNPLENGGKFISIKTIHMKINKVIALINSILLHSRLLNLAKFHLQNVNDDFWLNVLVEYAKEGSLHGIYQTKKRLNLLLNNASKSITDEDVMKFKDAYPYVARDIVKDDIVLSLENRDKVCAWLFEQGVYYNNGSTSFVYQGNGRVIMKLLFDGKMFYKGTVFKVYPELHLKEKMKYSEYRAIANNDLSSGTNQSNISSYIDVIRLININFDHDDAASPQAISERVNSNTIGELVNLKKPGRTRTLPPKFVFNLIRQCYEFVNEHLSSVEDEVSLLDEVLNILSQAASKSTSRSLNPYCQQSKHKAWNKEVHRKRFSSERSYWFQTEAINCINRKYLKIGIKQVQHLNLNMKDRHKRIRDNESLFELFDVMQGSIQVLIGVIMARRQDELIKLKSYGNLSPNKDPFSEENIKIEYDLIFKVKKTGSQGINTIIKRPIPLSISKFIWQLEQFNIKAREQNLVRGKLSLFNKIDTKNYKLIKIDHDSYNRNFDALCDYMETDLVQYDNGELRRNYVRQHQFRRFFAMVFFWSKGFDGMDSLRWMLAHSDMEHLYNYISESETGAVLNGAKASVIVRGIVDNTSELANLEGIEKVRQIIAKRLTGDSSIPIMVETVSEAVEDYNDESYFTIPHISQIQRERDVETEVINLLEEDKITLEPEFFTVTDVNGSEIKTFNLILKIKDCD